jgi:hypothetical protein
MQGVRGPASGHLKKKLKRFYSRARVEEVAPQQSKHDQSFGRWNP